MNTHLRVVPSRVSAPSRPGLSVVLLAILVGALSGVIAGWVLSIL